MENCICRNKSLLTKEREKEIYWGATRWINGAKGSFIFGLCVTTFDFLLLSIFTLLLFTDPYARKEWIYLALWALCWVILIIFVLRIVLQGRIVANKNHKLKRMMKGSEPAYTEIEFYSDHMVHKCGIFDDVTKISYDHIAAYRETKHYCVLTTVAHDVYTYGIEEFEQGSADEAYALITQYLMKEADKG